MLKRIVFLTGVVLFSGTLIGCNEMFNPPRVHTGQGQYQQPGQHGGQRQPGQPGQRGQRGQRGQGGHRLHGPNQPCFETRDYLGRITSPPCR